MAENGWIGFTDHYWMSTLVPPPGQPFTAVTKYAAGDRHLPDRHAPAGARRVAARRHRRGRRPALFAGAKEWATLRDYQHGGTIDRFVDAIDWGWFFFLTKPIFRVLH